MDDMLIKFKEVIDEEIQAYETLDELYSIKQSILVQRKSDALWDIDSQIVKEAEIIKEINKKRKNVAKYLGNEDITLAEVIEKAKQSNKDLADKLSNQKERLNLLSNSLSHRENTNLHLIKHGLVMVQKTLDIIVDAIVPQTKQYNKDGKNTEMDKSLISSIIEEA